ncbi:MAG: hypothetical protein IJ612_01750 [Prevotella sp.]|nr:hypothetical protein [Prevotella sp.]
MSSFKNLEMAAAVSMHEHIAIKKTLFSQKAVYTPTQSVLKVFVQEYPAAEGERLERLLDMAPAKMAADIASKGKPAPSAIGQYRLEVCLSDDGQFCAAQLFRFIDFKYHPANELIICEGDGVAAIAQLVEK